MRRPCIRSPNRNFYRLVPQYRTGTTLRWSSDRNRYTTKSSERQAEVSEQR
jgi:hypothetical protein